MIKKLKIKNFRSLKDITIYFEDDITVLVGENDSGKTSVIDALKIMFEGKKPEIDDFYWNTNEEISIEIETEDTIFIKVFSKNEENEDKIQPETKIIPKREYLERIREEITCNDFDSLSDNEKRRRLIYYASIFGVPRGNIKTDTLRDRVLKKIEELLASEGAIEGNIPNYNIYFLDGKDFEDISKFFQEVFFKEKGRSIWNEEVKDGKTVESIIRDKLDEYAKELKAEIKNKGIKEKLKSFLPELNDVTVKPIFEPKDINIGVKVQLLEKDNKEITVDKKGDGTKRRITMALLEYKKAKEEEPTLYVFDEPDTHLHVKAQVELLNIIRQFNESGKQLIIATHSPFIMNSVKPRQIRLLELKNGETKIKSISENEGVERILRCLGIENIDLFFSRRILIVEGETEEKFIPLIYEKLYGKSLRSVLVRIVNRKGITDIPRFAEVLLEFVKPNEIFILIDNDVDEEIESLIRELHIPDENVFRVGRKEFEDAFDAEIIYEAWKSFVESKGKPVGSSWTLEEISRLREECISEGKKFSEELKKLNKGDKGKKPPLKMKKPVLAQALAEYCKKEHLPQGIQKLLDKLHC